MSKIHHEQWGLIKIKFVHVRMINNVKLSSKWRPKSGTADPTHFTNYLQQCMTFMFKNFAMNLLNKVSFNYSEQENRFFTIIVHENRLQKRGNARFARCHNTTLFIVTSRSPSEHIQQGLSVLNRKDRFQISQSCGKY